MKNITLMSNMSLKLKVMNLVTETAAAEGLIFVATCALTACICFRPKLTKILFHHQLE